MYCGNCYTMCPSLPIADGTGDAICIYVGGKVSNARGPARMSKAGHPVPAEQSSKGGRKP